MRNAGGGPSGRLPTELLSKGFPMALTNRILARTANRFRSVFFSFRRNYDASIQTTSELPTTRQLSVHNGNPGQAVQTPAVRQISNQNPEPPGRLPPASPKLIGYLGNAGLGTGLLLRPSHRGSAQADATNCFLADFDRSTAGERNNVGKHPLP